MPESAFMCFEFFFEKNHDGWGRGGPKQHKRPKGQFLNFILHVIFDICGTVDFLNFESAVDVFN